MSICNYCQRGLKAGVCTCKAESVDYAVETNGRKSPLLTHMMNKRTKEECVAISQSEPEPEPEPVAYQWLRSSVIRKRIPKNAEISAWVPLYAHPPQRQPLTEDAVREEAYRRANAGWALMCKKMVAIERDACAEIINDNTDSDGICCADDLLAAIRARGLQGGQP